MRQKFAILVATTIALISACAPATQFEDHTGHITVENQVVNVETGFVFMEITNNHDEAVTLTGATTRVADSVVLAPTSDGIEIAGNKTLKLVESGHHLKLVGLKKNLSAGSEITITLAFSDGHAVDVLIPVKVIKK